MEENKEKITQLFSHIAEIKVEINKIVNDLFNLSNRLSTLEDSLVDLAMEVQYEINSKK